MIIRNFRPPDFDLLLDLANQAVPFAAEGNQEWLEYRKAFNEALRVRRHYIAEEKDRAVGYGCLEQQGEEEDVFRMFVVCHPERLVDVGELLMARIIEAAEELSARTLWVREYQQDRPINEFFIRHGFDEVHRFTLPEELPMIVLRRELN